MKLTSAVLAVLACACEKAATPSPTTEGSGSGSSSGDAAPIIIVTKSEITINGKLVGEVPDFADIVSGRIPPSTRQLITGVLDTWSSTRATLQLWTRTAASVEWSASGPASSAVIGRNGAAWGIGLHGASFSPAKQEGDGKAPAGVFRLRGSYGYSDKPPAGTKLPYAKADKLECVDDPTSRHYTQILDGSTVTRDWTSSEQMRGTHDYYEWVIDIAHNEKATPEGGSCIFFHVWGGADSTTDGCTALAEDALVGLLAQLDPAAEPLYVLLPRAEYNALQPIWALPPLR